MIYFCCDQLRRTQLVGKPLNGIDYLEVLVDHDAPNPADRQRKLFVHFINPLTGGALSKSNVRIEGGERVRDIIVTEAQVDATDETVLDVQVDRPGDFSSYTLRLVQDALHPQPPDGIDPMFATVDFSFKVECPTDFDCRPRCVCPPTERREPEIDYWRRITRASGA